ncbi:RNase adapter RapZ [Lachnospiraceae bacterium ZAX-1]
MKFVILTGMSGAGKSTALKMMEDIGYFCVDNLPIPLIYKFSELANLENSELQKVAVGIDIRSGQALEELQQILEQLHKVGRSFEILYLDSNDNVLVKRFKETRRSHPLAKDDHADKGIALERMKMEFLKRQADYIIDTSLLLTRELKAELDKIFVKNQRYKNLMITIVSFGFKYGNPTDSDLVFDVRFLPNPYYIEELKYKTGNDKEIQEYVMQFEASHQFLDKLEDMVLFLLPNYIIEGKNRLVISIGCTGGKHRSVTLSNELYKRLKNQNEYGIKIEHRDIAKDAWNNRV